MFCFFFGCRHYAVSRRWRRLAPEEGVDGIALSPAMRLLRSSCRHSRRKREALLHRVKNGRCIGRQCACTTAKDVCCRAHLGKEPCFSGNGKEDFLEMAMLP